jgi:hypothetical protein
MKMVVYGFGNALATGFGATIDRPGQGLFGRFGIRGKDVEDGSSNYQELRNLVETVEEEAAERAAAQEEAAAKAKTTKRSLLWRDEASCCNGKTLSILPYG